MFADKKVSHSSHYYDQDQEIVYPAEKEKIDDKAQDSHLKFMKIRPCDFACIGVAIQCTAGFCRSIPKVFFLNVFITGLHSLLIDQSHDLLSQVDAPK